MASDRAGAAARRRAELRAYRFRLPRSAPTGEPLAAKNGRLGTSRKGLNATREKPTPTPVSAVLRDTRRRELEVLAKEDFKRAVQLRGSVIEKESSDHNNDRGGKQRYYRPDDDR